jgi:chemotaxis protein MotA
MNFSTLIGIIAALAVFGMGVVTSTSNTQIFLNVHAILVVVGGTAAVGIICFPLPLLLTLCKVCARKLLGKYAEAPHIVIRECTDLARGYRDDPTHLVKSVKSIKTHFLRDSIELVIQGGISDDTLNSIMEKRAGTQTSRHEEEAEIFKTLAKFPPAFGLMATTLGMISLLQTIGSPDSFKQIGPAMAIGLVGTLYGLVLANFVFIPIGEHLTKLNRDDEAIRNMIVDGVKMIRRKDHPLIVQETLMSYLLPKERERYKSQSNGLKPKAKAA